MVGKRSKRDKWIWMPHAGHFIAGNQCQFRLNTYLGNGYLVSTVGEYDSPSGREDSAFTEIGWQRTYETMVFEAKPSTNKCCPFESVSGRELDMEGYTSPDEAYEGHLKMCEKWASKLGAQR